MLPSVFNSQFYREEFAMTDASPSPNSSPRKWITNYGVFFRKFGCIVDPDTVLPDYRKGFDFAIISGKCLTRVETLKRIIDGLKTVDGGRHQNLINFDQEEVFERFHSTSHRLMTQDEPIWARTLPDETKQFEYTSFSRIRAGGVYLMTLPECLLIGIKYLINQDVCWVTSPARVVLSGGSIDENGFVPYVFIEDGRICVHSHKPDKSESSDLSQLWEVIVPNIKKDPPPSV